MLFSLHLTFCVNKVLFILLYIQDTQRLYWKLTLIEILPKLAGIHLFLVSWVGRLVMVCYCAEHVWQFGLHRAFRDLLMRRSLIGHSYIIYLQVCWYKNNSWVKCTESDYVTKKPPTFTKFYRTERRVHWISSSSEKQQQKIHTIH